ncbi:MAG: phytanoyl-CoA dioxygenase family protein [Chloroflexota bacterium]
MKINVTPSELATETLTPSHLQRAVNAILEDGYVVLANVVNHACLDILRERMDADSQELIVAQKWGGAGHVEGHLQQGPPPFSPYVHRDIVANPFTIQVSHALLGDGFYNRFYNGNCNCPGSGTQPLHADGPHIWKDLPIAHPPVSLVINVSPVETTEENGATEIWPGTHRIPNIQNPISPAQEAARREIVPPVRAVAPKGGLVIRDMRLWHRGVPNHSDRIRHMIAMVYQSGWMARERKMLYHQDCVDQFPESALDHNAEFTNRPIEYLYVRFPQVKAGSTASG